jgi:hypothetical protein
MPCSGARTVFARSNAVVMGLSPTQDMDVCVCLFCACAVLYVGIYIDIFDTFHILWCCVPVFGSTGI